MRAWKWEYFFLQGFRSSLAEGAAWRWIKRADIKIGNVDFAPLMSVIRTAAVVNGRVILPPFIAEGVEKVGFGEIFGVHF